MKRTIRIGRVFGIPIVLDYSWILIAMLVAGAIYLQLDRRFQSAPAGRLWGIAIGGAILFFLSVLVHELSHSVAATRRGMKVRRIRLFIFGGVSELTEEAGSARDEFVIAVVGPLSSVVLGGGFLLVGLAAGGELRAILLFLAFSNIVLGVFNLVPGFPLDGGRVLRSVVWGATGDLRLATRVAVWGGRIVAMLLGGIGLLFVVVGNDPGGLWTLAIGWFLFQAAGASQREMDFRDALRGVTVSDVMVPTPLWVSHDLTLQELFERYLGPGDSTRLPVLGPEGRYGVIGAAALEKVDQAAWTRVTVGAVAEPATAVAGDVSVDKVLMELAQSGGWLVVTETGHPRGLVRSDNVVEWVERASA